MWQEMPLRLKYNENTRCRNNDIGYFIAATAAVDDPALQPDTTNSGCNASQDVQLAIQTTALAEKYR